MVTLRHAFDSNSMKGLVLKILRGTYPDIPSNYSTDLKDLISIMLIKDPIKRPSIRKVLEMDFLKSRISELLLNSTSKQEFDDPSMQKKLITYSSLSEKTEDKSERKALKDKTNMLKESKKNKVFKSYINFKKSK